MERTVQKYLKLLLAFAVMLGVSLAIPLNVSAAGISKTSVTLFVNQKTTLKVSETSKTPSWSTSNPKVATVSKGVVTAKKAGTAIITAKIGSTKYTCKVTVKSNIIKVTFNGNGGTTSKTSKTVTRGKTYGTLAAASRKGYTFTGWYTQKSGGVKVTSNKKVSATKAITLYAHWKKKLTDKDIVMKALEGKWCGNSSSYMNTYVKFTDTYSTWYHDDGTIIRKVKITSITKTSTDHYTLQMTGMDGSRVYTYEYRIELNNGKTNDVWYYFKSPDLGWCYSGSSSLHKIS